MLKSITPILIAGLLCGINSPGATAASRPPVIGIVDNTGHRYIQGCGCSLWSPGLSPDPDDPSTWKYLFLDSYEESRGPVMRIDGRIVKLHLVRKTGDRDPKPGSPWRYVYTAPHLMVTIRGTVVELLDEGYVVRGTITVKKGRGRTEVRFEGDCGC